MKNNYLLPQRIHDRRKELGLTLKEIAKRVGKTEATVQRWESGSIKTLRYENIVRIADALNTTPAYLMGWDDVSVDVVEYDTNANRFISKRKKLHHIIDEAPDNVLSFIESLLSLSPQQLEVLASLTARSRDESEL